METKEDRSVSLVLTLEALRLSGLRSFSFLPLTLTGIITVNLFIYHVYKVCNFTIKQYKSLLRATYT
jgi:hypothetical protein